MTAEPLPDGIELEAWYGTTTVLSLVPFDADAAGALAYLEDFARLLTAAPCDAMRSWAYDPDGRRILIGTWVSPTAADRAR